MLKITKPFMEDREFDLLTTYRTKDGKEGTLITITIDASQGEPQFILTLLNEETDEIFDVFESDMIK